MKKVCMIVPSFSAKGGITAVVSGYKNSKLENIYEIRYIETYSDGRIIKKVISAVTAYIKFIYILISWHPDLIHIHSSFGGSFYRKIPFILLGHMVSIPIVNHIHGSYYDEFFFQAKESKKKLIRAIFKKCDYFIALSSKAKTELKKIVNEEKISIIENYGIIHENAVEERKRKSNNHTVLFLGFITEKKGCFDIPSICELVAKKIPDVKFVLAGVGELEALKGEITNSLMRHFEFPGWISGVEKDHQLRNADIFLLPSYSEGMPMAILDAMGYGLPIVATKVGGVPQIVHHNENGYLADPGEVEKLSEYIIRLLSNKEEIDRCGGKSVEIIREKFSFDIHLSKLEKIYKQLEK